MSQSKLLVIAPFCPEIPLRGYEKFLKYHIAELVTKYDVDLVTLGTSGSRKLHHPLGVSSQTEVQCGFFSRVFGGVLCLLKGLPIQCSEFYALPFRRTIEKKVALGDYDKVVCYMARTFAAVPPVIHDKTIVFGIDPLVVSYRLSARVSGLLMRMAYQMEGFLIGHFENYIIKNVNCFALISKHDIRRYLRLFRPENQIEHIRYGVKLAKSNTPLIGRDSQILVVSGSGFYAPNVRALKYLLEFVWPKVSKLGYFRLQIIGADIDPQILKLARAFSDIEVVGFVDNVFEYLSNAFACLCLVEIDVGVQTKLLEAMSCGTPAICSRASVKGVGAIAGREVLVAQSPEEIVTALEMLRADLEKWQSISRNSYEFINHKYQWTYSTQDLLRIIQK
jgi:glycosyltransferase involved in cell wall biosynthesis